MEPQDVQQVLDLGLLLDELLVEIENCTNS